MLRSTSEKSKAGLGIAGGCLRREEHARQREHQGRVGVGMGICEEQQAPGQADNGKEGGKGFLSLRREDFEERGSC